MTLIAARILPKFRWNIEAQRYIAANGRYTARETVKAGSEMMVAQAGRDIEEVSGRFQRGEITHAAWDAAMRLNCRRVVVGNAILASGGIEHMTPAKWGRAGALTKEQNKYLNGFGERIQSGYYGEDLSRGGFMEHARLYGMAGHGVYEYVQARNAIEDLGHNQISNLLSERTEAHCHGDKSCQAMTELDWVDIGEDGQPVNEEWLWPGDRLCISRCQCSVKTRVKL